MLLPIAFGIQTFYIHKSTTSIKIHLITLKLEVSIALQKMFLLWLLKKKCSSEYLNICRWFPMTNDNVMNSSINLAQMTMDSVFSFSFNFTVVIRVYCVAIMFALTAHNFESKNPFANVWHVSLWLSVAHHISFLLDQFSVKYVFHFPILRFSP